MESCSALKIMMNKQLLIQLQYRNFRQRISLFDLNTLYMATFHTQHFRLDVRRHTKSMATKRKIRLNVLKENGTGQIFSFYLILIRSLRRFCFHRRLSVWGCLGGGGLCPEHFCQGDTQATRILLECILVFT